MKSVTVEKVYNILTNQISGVMKRCAEDAREEIHNKSVRGVDSDGAAFAPYTERYAKRKGSTKVDLTVTGDMLNSMVIIKINGGYALTFRPDVMPKARGNQTGHRRGGKTTNPRHFFGLSGKTLKAILGKELKLLFQKNGIGA